MRKFNITLTTNNNSGPFDIYYTSEGQNIIAPLVSGSYATNISASQLTAGVNILADYGVSNIYVVNNKETCNSIQSLSQTPKTNPYACVTYLVKNSSSETATISYIDCNGNIQTGTIPPFSTGNFTTSNGAPTCVSNCSGLTSTPDPQYCKYYSISNPCSSIAIDIKYIDCSGTPQIVKVAPNQTLIVQAIANTIYGYSGNCGTPFTKNEIDNPYAPNPNSKCQDFIAVNNCSLPAIISYTDCGGNISTLDIPAGASIPYSSLSQGYICYSGDCNCLAVYTPTQTCGFDFSILGSYTPEVPPPPTPTYKLSPSKLIMNEGETITVTVETTNVNAGTVLYWGIFFYTGTSSDLDTPATGTVTIDSNGKASFNITAKADNLTEPNGDQLIFARLFPTSGRVYDTMLAESKGISIKDTSQATVISKVCGVRAYDTNIYRYEYTDNYQAIPPSALSSPNTLVVRDVLGLYEYPLYPRSYHQYSFIKNGVKIDKKPMASSTIKRSEFSYAADFPWRSSIYVTSSDGSQIRYDEEKTFTDNRGEFVYPLNANVLTFENTTYKNTNSSTYYTDAFVSDIPTVTAPWIKGAYYEGSYAYLVPRTSTYALTGSVSFSFRGNDTRGTGPFETDQIGPSVFRIFGVIEKSTTPKNASSWTKIAYTEMSKLPDNIIKQNNRANFAYNQQESLIWFDNDMQNLITFQLNAQTEATITAGNYVRFTLYWQDINGVFFTYDKSYDVSGANDLKFTIGSSTNPSMFSIIDKTLRS